MLLAWENDMPRTLLYQSTNVQQLPLSPSEGVDPTLYFTLSSPILRPRIEGYQGEQGGPTVQAKVADRAMVTFEILFQSPVLRPPVPTVYPTWLNLSAYLTVREYPLNGSTTYGSQSGISPTSVWDYGERDVTGYLQAGRGRITVPVDVNSVVQVFLRVGIGNFAQYDRTGATASPLTTVQVLGDELWVNAGEEWDGRALA
jgi:hypothetical protein